VKCWSNNLHMQSKVYSDVDKTGNVRTPRHETRSCNHCCSWKARNITYCECLFIAFVIEHEMRIRHIVICGLPRSEIFIHIISIKHDFRKNAFQHKMCVLISSTNLSETFLILIRTERDTIQNV
jgi:hypothetical protein